MEDLFKGTQQDFEKCCGPNDRFEEIADQFASVTNRAKSVIKGAEAVLRKRAATAVQHPAGDQSTLQGESTEKRSKLTVPRRTTRTQNKHICVFIIKTFHARPWDKETHIIGQGKAFEQGRQLCSRGTLYSLDVESQRLGSVTASVFVDAIATGKKYFYLATEGALDDVSSDDMLQAALECYQNCRKVYNTIDRSQVNNSEE
jgi:hypothetical protein